MTEYQIDSVKIESGSHGVIVCVNRKRKDSGYCSSDEALFNVRNFAEFTELIQKSIGVSLEQFLNFQFVSNSDRFDEALKDKIYNADHITSHNIEDRILVPALDDLLVPNTKMFPFDAIDKYWDKCIATGLLAKITKRDYNNYYDSENWCKHMNTKLKNVKLSHVNEDTLEITVKPKGSSYWYIKINDGNKDIYALCGFGHNFIFYND